MNSLIERLRLYFFIVFAELYILFPFHHFIPWRGPQRILIVPQLTRVGDLVCVTPVFKAIKSRYPGSYVAVVVAEYAYTAAILKHNPSVDDIIILKNNEYLTFFGLFRFFKRIRDGKFDTAINLAASTLGTLIGVFGLIPKRIKIVRFRRPLSEILTDWMSEVKIRYIEGGHIPTLYLRALEPLHIPIPSSIQKEIFTSQSGEEKAKMFLKKHSVHSEDLIVGISVTAGNDIKEWGLERFGEFASQLIRRYNARIIFIGAPRDRDKLERTNKFTSNRGIVTTDFNLEELPSLLKRLSLFISADNGPMHMAHALGVPLIDIIGPVDPYEQAPLNDPKAVVVQPPKDVKPTIFALRPPGNPEESRRAVREISVQSVLEAFHTLYANMQS